MRIQERASDVSCVAISACVLLIGLASIQVNGLSVGAHLAVLCILLCARYREAGGASARWRRGCQWGWQGSIFLCRLRLWQFSGGIFGRVGELPPLPPLLSSTATALLTMELTNQHRYFEVFVASLCFVAIPEGGIKLRLHDLGEPPAMMPLPPLVRTVWEMCPPPCENRLHHPGGRRKLGAGRSRPCLDYDRVAERVCSVRNENQLLAAAPFGGEWGLFRVCVAACGGLEQLPRRTAAFWDQS